MENGMFEEIFQRIQILEDENKKLKEELNKPEENKNMEKDSFSELYILIKEENFDKFKQENKFPEYEKKGENKNLCEILINFKPYDDLDFLEIEGDFTGWKKIKMTKEGQSFLFQTRVLKGYIYKYNFNYNENRMLDLDAEIIEENSDLNFNIIRVYDEDSNEGLKIQDKSINLFELIENELKINMTFDEEKSYFKNFLEYSKLYTTKIAELNKLKKETEMKNRTSFENIFEICNNFEKEKNKTYNPFFVNRILNYNDHNYLIISLNLIEGYLKCLKLYDKNGIKIDINNVNNLNVAERFPFDKLYENCMIYTKEDSDEIIKEHSEDRKNILMIYYELISIGSNLNSNNNLNRLISQESIENLEDVNMEFESGGVNIHQQRRRSNIPEQKEIMPYKITPENIDLNNYNISIVDNVIKSIQSEFDEKLFICFDSKLIKEEVSNEFNGLVSNSVLKVYTSMHNKDIINILHIHLNDTSKEISIDSKFLEKFEKIEDQKVFNLDAQGKKLDYKLIFKDFNLVKIFYNFSENFVDEPNFEEIRFQEENIVKINFGKSSYNGFYGKIKCLPVGMLARKDKDDSDDNSMLKKKNSISPSIQGLCDERHLEDLNGMIDITLMFSPDMYLMEQFEVISIPTCKVVTLSAREQIPFETILAKNMNNKIKERKIKIKEFCEFVQNLKALTEDQTKLNSTPIEELKKYLTQFEELNIEEEFELTKLEDYEREEMTNKLNEAEENISGIVFKLQIHVRNHFMFSNKNK